MTMTKTTPTPTLLDRVSLHARTAPRAPALDSPTARVDYGALEERALVLASVLAARGVVAGERVMVALASTPGAVVATLAVQALGALPIEVNRDAGKPMLEAAFKRSGARFVFLTGRDARTWGELLAGHDIARAFVLHTSPVDERMLHALGLREASTLFEDGRVSDPVEESAPQVRPVPVSPDDKAAVLFTSGSTGEPRGVIHSWRNVRANTESIIAYLGITASERAMLIMPFAYTFGRSVVQTHLWAGASVFLDPRFMYPNVVMDALHEERCTSFAGVPLTYDLLRRQVAPEKLRAPSLRYVTQAGGGASRDLATWMHDTFAPVPVFIMYGQTEATARLSYVPPARAREKLGSIGIGIPGVELAVVDENGARVADNTEGFLVARGENVTPGYLDAPEATAEILRDGWLWTGDLARRDDDGFFFVTGRAKDIVKIGGRRVNPAEIVPVLLAHASVDEAAVIDVPDGDDRALVAAVVKRAGAFVDADELQRLMRRDLPGWLVPRRVLFLDALPRTANGKLSRAALRDIVMSET
jgi:long-chain acyl-CoA synthetase